MNAIGPSAIDRNLLSGERVLWRGKPLPGLTLAGRDAFLIPFSLLWGGFAVFWNASVWTTGAPLEFKLFGLPFLAMGLYITVGRFFVDARTRHRLEYAVTDKRVLIAKDGSGSIRSVDLKHMPVLEFNERSDGTGTIQFGVSASPFGGGGLQFLIPGMDPTPQLLRIADVRKVYGIIARAAGT